MRALFGVLGLLVVVAVVGVLAKKQLASVPAPPQAAGAAPGVMAPAATPQQSVQQFRNAVDAAVQPPRAMPDEPK